MRLAAAATVLAVLAGAAAEAQTARTLRDVVYTTVPRPLVLDLNLPAGPGPHPVIVFVHGGGWSKGDEDLSPQHPAMQQVARGYAVASVEYRLSGEAKFPAPIQDCRAAIRWLRANAAHYDLDPGRFAAWGSSAGGHLVALLGTSGEVREFDDPAQGNAEQSSRVQGVVDWYGPADFSVSAGGSGPNGPVGALLGCDPFVCTEVAAWASPVAHVDPTDPPFLIQHGSADPVVPPIHSALLHAALLAAAVPSQHDVMPGASHGGQAFMAASNVARIGAWLDAVLPAPRP